MARRARINGAAAPLLFEDYPIPEQEPGMVRIRITNSGVCHSDVHIRDDNGDLGVKYRDVIGEEMFNSIVMGHEIAGCIEAGSDADLEQCGLKLQDKVVVYPWLGCQKCGVCNIGLTNVCQDPAALFESFGTGPKRTGGYQTHLLVEPRFVIKVPDNVPMDMACLLACSGGTAFSAVKRLSCAVQFGSSSDPSGQARFMVIGAGGLGLWAVKLARVVYGDKVWIMAADVDQDKLQLAKQYGADELVQWNRAGTVDENVAIAMANGKIHAAIDFVGGASTAQTAVKCLTKNGSLVLVGLHGGFLNLHIPQVALGSISVMGTAVMDMATFKELVELVSSKGISYPDITHYSLDQVNVALELLGQGKVTGRAVLVQE